MAVVAALLRDPALVHRVRVALRARHVLLVCDDWATLTHTCAERPVQLALFDLHEDGVASWEAMRTLRRRFPRVAMVAHCVAVGGRARDLFEAGRAGLDGVVIAAEDDEPARILALLEQAEARSVGSQLRVAVTGRAPMARDAALIAVTRAHERLTPEALARQLLVPRRLLARRLVDAGFPPPHQLLTWGRLMVAAHLLEDDSRSADSVAMVLDFASGSAFRNLCRRYLGATPHEVRAGGGGTFVIERFLAACGPCPTRAAATRRAVEPRPGVGEAGDEAVV